MAKAAPRKVEIALEYQNYIESPPVSPKQLYSAACSSDSVTIESWRQTWIDQTTANHKRFGSFKDHSIGTLQGSHLHKPAIIVGSGPSLKHNGHLLKDRGDLLAISCLHNYHFLEDRGITPDYYVTLDAGPIVIDEVYDGGSKTPEEYWESTKNKTLLAFIGTNPKLFDLWKGKVLLFNAPIPDQACIDAQDKLEIFNSFIGNGGNVLGACMYIARAVLGCSTTVFLGADFSFSYDKKFHGWNSKYDANLGHVLKGIDVFGNKVLTWQSYFNFKNWFDYIALTIPGIYINCTEGGMLGAYPEGNLMAVRQMSFSDFLDMTKMSDHVKENFLNPLTKEKKLLF